MRRQKKPFTWDQLELEIRAMYCPALNPKATLNKHLTAIRQIRRVAATPADLDVVAIATLVQQCEDRGLKPRSINSILAHLRIQANYLKKRGVIEISPFAVKRMFVRKGKTSKRSLSVDELARVFALADDDVAPRSIGHLAATPYFARLEERRVWRARRLRALIYLLAFTGVRASEALEVARHPAERLVGRLGMDDLVVRAAQEDDGVQYREQEGIRVQVGGELGQNCRPVRHVGIALHLPVFVPIIHIVHVNLLRRRG